MALSLDPFAELADVETSHAHLPAEASGVHPAHARFRVHSPRSPYVRRMFSKSKQAALNKMSPRLRGSIRGKRAERRILEQRTGHTTPRTRSDPMARVYSVYGTPFWHFY